MAQKYLNNKDLLAEIHKSKMSFCWIKSPQYDRPDIIVDNVKDINKSLYDQAKQNKAGRMKDLAYQSAIKVYEGPANKKPKQKDFLVDPATISDEDITFRVMDMEHIPDEPGRKKNPRNLAETKAKVNFPAFKHYAKVNGEISEVARSHWKGGLKSGKFCVEHGSITNELGKMYLKLVERYSQRANWRGYTYIDEMRGQALLQLAMIGLQFNEAKSDNPFAYYTAAITNSFTRVLNIEKRNQTIRDDILIDSGHLPSYGRQIAHEEEMKAAREEAENSKSDA
tara:strand:- start:2611 stop:3456 length:846 start_codon:yes stop_codon:yes gene_type:complete